MNGLERRLDAAEEKIDKWKVETRNSFQNHLNHLQKILQ
jgi:hypothetical protein